MEQEGDLLLFTVRIYDWWDGSFHEVLYVLTIRLEEDGGFKYLSYVEIGE